MKTEKLNLEQFVKRVNAPGESETFKVEITTDIANYIVGNINDSNRDKNQNTIDSYAEEMKRGVFYSEFSGPLQFYTDGRCGSAQHRCLALIECGIPQPFLVQTKVPLDMIPFIDSGRSRKPANALQVHHIENSADIAPAIITFLKLGIGITGTPRSVSNYKFPRDSYYKTYFANPEIFNHAFSSAKNLFLTNENLLKPSDNVDDELTMKTTFQLPSVKKFGLKVIAGMMFNTLIDSAFKTRALDEFWKPLFLTTTENPQILLLKKWLLADEKENNATPIYQRMIWIIKAYNNFFGEKLKGRIGYNPKKEKDLFKFN